MAENKIHYGIGIDGSGDGEWTICGLCGYYKTTINFKEITCQRCWRKLRAWQKNWTGERCQICGRPYRIYYDVTDEKWRAITGIKDGSGLVCLDCLDALAAQRGIKYKLKTIFGLRMMRLSGKRQSTQSTKRKLKGAHNGT